eukprot:12857761-Alexandrium_andersonii.AAC.1
MTTTIIILSPPREAPPPRNPPRSASGARAGPCRRHILHLHEQRRRTHPSGALAANFETVSGAAQFKLRTTQAIF